MYRTSFTERVTTSRLEDPTVFRDLLREMLAELGNTIYSEDAREAAKLLTDEVAARLLEAVGSADVERARSLLDTLRQAEAEWFLRELRADKRLRARLSVIEEVAECFLRHNFQRDGASEIATERRRQLSKENWTGEHDDEHQSEELAWAAVCYAAPEPIFAEVEGPCGCRSVGECHHVFGSGNKVLADPWPWDESDDKRAKHDRRRRLVIAGALIAAEVDRLDRLAAKEKRERDRLNQDEKKDES